MSSKKELSFEEAMESLEEIVSKLESGEVSLEESLKLYQDGKKLAKLLEERLSSAEEKVKELVKKDEGVFEEKPLNLEKR
jgi:exodeoxyribonuclease VII small subunit